MLVLADDLTGTLEAGVLFAQAGVECFVSLSSHVMAEEDAVQAVDLETRHLPGHIAAKRVIAAVTRIAQRPKFIYKKTDSALRGNVRAELRALSRFGPVMYVPAYPDMGRTVVGGCLFIDGVPLEQTHFRDDPRHPGGHGDLRRMLREQDDITVHDATTNGEMDALAKQWLDRGGCAAGPCGLLQAVAKIWSNETTRQLPRLLLRRVLVICGSLHPISRAQLDAARSLFDLKKWELLVTDAEFKTGVDAAAVAVAEFAALRFRQAAFDAAVVFGGDTVRAFLNEMAVDTIEPLGEFLPGVAICRLPDRRILITKAGGLARLTFYNRSMNDLTADKTKTLGITLGDPHGVGPEILLRSYAAGELPDKFVVFGDRRVLEFYRDLLKIDVDFSKFVFRESSAPQSAIEPGRLSSVAGAAAREYIVNATQAALSGSITGIVTLPVNKEAVQLTDPGFTGHTELIGELCGSKDVTIMLVSDRLIVTHVSTHVSLKTAIERVKKERVLKIVELTAGALRRLRPGGRIAVAGLNPHAGENGLFGDEEIREIGPAVEEARHRGIDVDGPIAPDTVFHFAVAKGKYAAVVCMYHDQGHIPLKLLDFEGGVNVALGLPIVRTSVDHGTAFDIAGKGVASTTSFLRAVKLAQKLTTG